MLTTLRKIGNSKGLILPAPFLAACGITHEVDLRLEGRTLVLEAPKPLRQGWFEGVLPEDPAETAEWDRLEAADTQGDEEWDW